VKNASTSDGDARVYIKMPAESPVAKPSVRDLLRTATDNLTRRGVSAPRLSAEWLAEEAFGLTRTQRLLGDDIVPSPEARVRFAALVERRMRHEPLQYILGVAHFMGLQLRIDRRVLIPRPETETVVEHALREIEEVDAPRVLDVGTGSGCIAIAISHARKDALVAACDISGDALELAEKNAETCGVSVTFFEADILSGRGVPDTGQYDLIVSNPPYVPASEQPGMQPDVVDYEPHLALFSGEDPLVFYRAIAEMARSALVHGGSLVLETHADFGSDVAAMLETAGFESVRILQDLAGKERIAMARRPGV
jgi:release factor glutamine methyltransferase